MYMLHFHIIRWKLDETNLLKLQYKMFNIYYLIIFIDINIKKNIQYK